MAHRISWNVAITGSQVVGKAFMEAYKQANSASSKSAASAAAKKNVGGLGLSEARKISGVDDGELNLEEAKKKYDFSFDANSKEKSGSFYLQSKVYRAWERIKAEVGEPPKGEAEAKTTENKTN